MLACTLLLTLRIVCLMVYATLRTSMEPNTFLFFACINEDTAWYLTANIMMALVWQYWLIAKILSPTEREAAPEPETLMRKKENKYLYLWQAVLSLYFFIDVTFITAHYAFGAWTSDQVISGDNVKQDTHWIIVRTSYKVIQMTESGLFILFAALVFWRVYGALEGVPCEEGVRLRRQTIIFTIVFFSQVLIRFSGQVVNNCLWINRNLIVKNNDIAEVNEIQEITVLVCAITEIFLDVWLVLYLFLG